MRSDTHGNWALQACMQALVLLNLVFVQMTGAAGLHWLVPLYGLALAAPLLARLRGRFVYRALWNVGVVAFFLVLVRSALGLQLAYVLEGGLVLAALCQVHLLNNLGTRQRPDLLFFNAFLIAIITGYMSRDVAFAAAFLAFAPCFVLGLQLSSATSGGRVLAPDVTRRLLVDGGRRAAVLLGLSLLAFVFWPRDFERKAFLHGRVDMTSGDVPTLELGFNEELKLDRRGRVGASDEPALRVALVDGERADVASLWRGATLSDTSGGAWHNEPGARSASSSDERWWEQAGGLVRAGPDAPRTTRVEVLRFAQDTERLFAPLRARALRLGPMHASGILRARLDGTVDSSVVGDARYELTLVPSDSLASPGGARLGDDLPPLLERYVALPDEPEVERARELAARLTADLAHDAPQHAFVTRLRDHLSVEYAYVAPGDDGAQSLDAFLRGDAGGHCEFFASALATMLRSLGVPCRVATGYRGERWDDEGRVLTFGLRDAHAWVEVFDPQAGWVAVDPSPAAVEQVAGTSAWARLFAAAGAGWRTVTDFDAERRAALYAWLRAAPARGARAARAHPLEALGLVALGAALVTLVVRRRRARTPAVIRAWVAAVRAARLRAQPGETPRELLARARAADVRPARLAALEAATRAHEALRYAA